VPAWQRGVDESKFVDDDPCFMRTARMPVSNFVIDVLGQRTIHDASGILRARLLPLARARISAERRLT